MAYHHQPRKLRNTDTAQLSNHALSYNPRPQATLADSAVYVRQLRRRLLELEVRSESAAASARAAAAVAAAGARDQESSGEGDWKGVIFFTVCASKGRVWGSASACGWCHLVWATCLCRQPSVRRPGDV